MPTYGAHAFVWVGAWTTQTGNHAIAEAGKAGFDFIEIPLLKPDEFDPQPHKQALDDAGIYATASLGLPPDLHMPVAPQKARDFLYRVMDKLQAIGGSYLTGCIGYSLGTLTGQPPTERERAIIIETLSEVAEEAQRRGVRLGLEACNRYETYLYNTLADTQDTVKAIRARGFDNIEVHGDTYHMNIEEEGFYNPIVGCAETLGYMHLSESHRGLVGSGTVHWPDVFRGLKDANYRGPLVLESFAAINPDLAAATCLWRPPNQPSEVLAREGLAFLRRGAEAAGLA